MYNIKTYYKIGNSAVPCNREKALQWFKKTAANGSAEAMRRIAYYYEHVYRGLTLDKEKAGQWYAKASERESGN